MARKFSGGVDCTGQQIVNVLFQSLGAEPGTPVAGRFYYDTAKKKFGYYNGTVWIFPTEGGGSEATSSTLGTIMVKGDLGGTGTSPTVVHFTLGSNSSANGFKITGLAEPTTAGDAATKAYVDGKINGQAWKAPVVVATPEALPAYTQSGSEATGKLEANANGALTIDGYAVAVNDRVLVKNAVEAKHNGIYTVTKKGAAGEKWALTRAEDATTGAQILQATMFVEKGTVNEDHEFNLATAPAITVDTTALEFVDQGGRGIKGDGKYTTRTGAILEILGDTTTPVEPAEGAVSSEGEGVTRKKTFRLRGNGVLTEFALTHNLNTRQILVQGQESSAGSPGVPIELDWEPTSANAIKVTFPAAVLAATNYFVTILG